MLVDFCKKLLHNFVLILLAFEVQYHDVDVGKAILSDSISHFTASRVIFVPHDDFISMLKSHTIIYDRIWIRTVSHEGEQFWFHVELRCNQCSGDLDGVHERLDSLLDRNISVPVECEAVQKHLNRMEKDRQVGGVYRDAICIVIEVEEAADVFPELIFISGVRDGVDDLFECFLKGEKTFATDKIVTTIPVRNLKGRAVLGNDFAHVDA